MLSEAARRLLKIPSEADLNLPLDELYDRWFAGRTYETRFGYGWSFEPRGKRVDGDHDLCLQHRTGQMCIGMDSQFKVYAEGDAWTPIASNYLMLVETDALLVESKATGEERRGLGKFPTVESFQAKYGSYLAKFEELPSPDHSFTRYFQGPQSMIITCRSWSDQHEICAIEYF